MANLIALGTGLFAAMICATVEVASTPSRDSKVADVCNTSGPFSESAGGSNAPMIVNLSLAGSRGAKCKGCRVVWDVLVTWPAAGAADVSFAGTASEFTVAPNETTTHSGNEDFDCSDAIVFLALWTGAGRKQALAAEMYSCTACPGKPE